MQKAPAGAQRGVSRRPPKNPAPPARATTATPRPVHATQAELFDAARSSGRGVAAATTPSAAGWAEVVTGAGVVTGAAAEVLAGAEGVVATGAGADRLTRKSVI